MGKRRNVNNFQKLMALNDLQPHVYKFVSNGVAPPTKTLGKLVGAIMKHTKNAYVGGKKRKIYVEHHL